jgi:putative ABC transport system substrate-binding protein
MTQSIKRREVLTLLGGAAAAWPLAARAQQGGRVRRVSALIGGDEGDAERQASVATLRSALAGLGWVEGRNLRIDWRWAASDVGRARTYAAELVSLGPDLLFGDNTFVVTALQQATRSLPIVFARVTDPIEAGFVSSLARPGGNITGFADRERSSLGKLAELMKEIAPHVTRVALITRDNNGADVRLVEAAASSVGLKLIVPQIQDPRTMEDAIVAFGKEPNGGLIITSDAFVLFHRKLIIELAARHKLPALYSLADYVRDGGLMSYGVDRIEQYRGVASYVDRILKGAKPSDLPVQLPIKYQLVVNLKTAKALGLDMPLSILMRIDEVIE